MPNKQYVRGRAFEYRVKNYLISCEYLVFRTAGSHGIADLIAFRGDHKPLLIQCKAGEGIESKREMKHLVTVSVYNNTMPILATKNKKGKIKFSTFINGEKVEIRLS